MSSAGRPPSPAHSQAGTRESSLQAHRRGYRRAVRIGLATSLVVHAVLILFVSRELRIGARAFQPRAQVVRPPAGIQMIEYRQVAEEPPPESLIELPPEEAARPPAERPVPALTPRPAEGEERVRGFTNAERLRPREGDRRLWRDYGDEPLPLYAGDPYALAIGAIRAHLARMLDSLELSEEQRRRAVEWLIGEGDDQVGITPEGIVIGDLLIPLNLGALFAEEGPNAREARQAARDLAEIRQSDFLMDAEAVRRERIAEMRRRTEEEIARRDSAAVADSTPPVEPPRP